MKKHHGDETEGSEDVKAFLAGPGQVPMIGSESGSAKANGIARFESPHGSVRFVYFEDRKPVSVLQVVRVGRTAHVANAYTLAIRRRRGIASKLMLEAARYADENGLRILPSEHQSPMGRAWWQAQVGSMKKNPLLSKPSKALYRLQNTRAFRELVGRPPTDADYEGVHTTGSELIAGSYAMSAWEQHDREGYPVIVTLDVSGLQPEPDVDAMLRGGEAIKLLRSQYKQAVDDGQTFYELLEEEGYGDEGEARPGDSPSAFIFEDVGLHVLGAIESTEDPEAIFEDFIERGLLPPEVLSKIVDQQRYLNDFDIDRVVRVEALKPWWPRVLVSFEDDDAQELADLGWEVFTLDEWPFKSPGATQTVWEAPDAAKRKDIEFHGTTSLVIDLAFPGLIPAKSPFQIRAL